MFKSLITNLLLEKTSRKLSRKTNTKVIKNLFRSHLLSTSRIIPLNSTTLTNSDFFEIIDKFRAYGPSCSYPIHYTVRKA